MVLEEETQQKLEISSEETTRKGKFPFHASEILGNCAFPLSFHRENCNEILIFFAVFLQLFLVLNELTPLFLVYMFQTSHFLRNVLKEG